MNCKLSVIKNYNLFVFVMLFYVLFIVNQNAFGVYLKLLLQFIFLRFYILPFLGSCRSCACISFFPPCFPYNLYFPVSSVLLSSRTLGLIFIVPWFCISGIMQFTVLLGFWLCVVPFPWGFGWSLWSLHSVPNPSARDVLYKMR